MSAASAGGAYSQPNTTSSANSTSVSSSSANAPATAAGPKKAGIIRIGVVMPKVQMSAGDPAPAAEALRNSFVSYLKGPSVEVIPLSARLASSVTEEARQSECDYVLYVSMSVKKGGGGSLFGRAIGNVAGATAGHIPGGGSATTGAARSAAIGSVYTTAAIVSSIKAKDEVTLEYRLEPTDPAKQRVANTAKAKASQDGEDVVTGLVEKAAGVVVATVSAKQ